MGKILKYVVGISIILILIPMFYLKQIYQLNNNNTASKGIIFSNIIKLEHYNNVGKGFDMLGSYVLYTRSDRHDDIIKIYKHFYSDKK